MMSANIDLLLLDSWENVVSSVDTVDIEDGILWVYFTL
jgi:hypothetical protein